MRLLSSVCLLCFAVGGAQADVGAEKDKPMHLAFVLLSEARAPKAEEVARAFASIAPKEQRLKLLGSNTEKAEQPAEALQFDLSPSGTAFIGLIPVAVPNREAEGAVQFSVSAMGTGWKLPVHKAHLVVSLRDVDITLETLSQFTSLLAAVTESSPAVGIYWGGAGATHDPKFFVSIARERDLVPIMLWTGVSVARDAKGGLSLLSLGMKQLNLPDMLLIAPKSSSNEALEAFFDLLGYAAYFGKPLPEGDTIGRSESERLPVHYVPSPIDPKTKVWRVELK